MKKALLISALLALPLTWYGCSDTSNSQATGTVNYSGPGSFYDVTMNYDNNEFEIQMSEAIDEPAKLTVSGTFERLSTGFLNLTAVTVTKFGGFTEGPAEGDTFEALDVPGFALLLKTDAGEMIPMLAMTDCPTEQIDMNWLTVVSETEHESQDARDARDPETEWAGTFTYDGAGVASVQSDFNLVDYGPVKEQPFIFESAECSNGILEVTEGEQRNANIWLTASGAALVETFNGSQERENIILAVPQESITVAGVSGTYVGMVLNGDAPQPISLDFDEDGIGSGGILTNVSSGERDANDSVTLEISDLSAKAGAGWLEGQLSIAGAGSGTGKMACAATTAAGQFEQNIMFCVGQSPDDNSNAFGLLLVSQD